MKPALARIRGGVFAEANLRGGGELGEAWHLAGNLANKQNVFDDFSTRCGARALVDMGYTKPEHLGIIGGSNGGLLMGAALVQTPPRRIARWCRWWASTDMPPRRDDAQRRVQRDRVRQRERREALPARPLRVLALFTT